MPFSGPRRAVPLALCLLTLAAAVPATASAQGWACESSALAATLGPSPRIEPITANKDQDTCKADAAGGNAPASPLPVTGSLLSATTGLLPPTGSPSAQTATAAAGLGELRVAGLPIPLERPDLSNPVFDPRTVPLVGTVDPRAALEAVIPERFDAELLNLRALRAEVTGRCVSGSPRLTGTSSVLGISVLGKELPVDRATSQTLSVVDSQDIDPSTLDPAILLPPGVTLSPEVRAALQQVLDGLPDVAVPATVARVAVTPGRRIEGGGRLTQHALDLTLSVGGQTLVDLTVGEATVGAAQVNCGGVADLALQCTSRPIVLIDVLRSKGKVRLLGAANRRYAGRRVKIRFTATGKVVARPRVRGSGLFRATAPLPRARLRATNRARYRAEIAGERSLRLKLVRRMLVSSTAVKGRRVTIAGRIVRPLGQPVREVIVKRRLSCGSYRVVKRFTPPASGAFRVTLAGPPRSQAAAYRLQTKVRKYTTNPKVFPTFTLPRYVDLAQ
jgi:hypothetical protein